MSTSLSGLKSQTTYDTGFLFARYFLNTGDKRDFIHGPDHVENWSDVH